MTPDTRILIGHSPTKEALDQIARLRARLLLHQDDEATEMLERIEGYVMGLGKALEPNNSEWRR